MSVLVYLRKILMGFYTYVNQAVLNTLNLPIDKIIGYDDSQFFDLSIYKQLKENDDEVLNKGIVVEKEETNLFKATGEVRIYHTVKKPLYDANNNIIGMCGISSDITEQKKLQKDINEKTNLLNLVLNNVEAHIYMKDEHRTFQYVNKKVADLFGLPAKDIIGKKETDILPEEVAEHFYQSDKKVFQTKEKQTIEEIINNEDGTKSYYLSVKIPFIPENSPPSLIGFSTDVTELYELKEEFRKQANTDSLTGLFNRRYFIEHAEREFNRAQRNKLPLTVISLDIDHFKEINDQYGHPVGDEVLVMISKSLLPNIRTEDVLARIGGEEFSIVLPDTDLTQGLIIAERIRKQQDSTTLKGSWQGEINIKVSVGIACLVAQDKLFDALFSRADKALYKAKNNGRNQVFCLKE